MKNRCILTFSLIMISLMYMHAQKEVFLKVNHRLGSQPFVLEKPLANNFGHPFTITRFDYYLSNFIIYHDGGKEVKIADSYILVRDGADFTYSLGTHDLTHIDSLIYLVGIDSLRNHADPSTYPAGHPLGNQASDMHWGWTGGYRFVALEGKVGAALDKTFQIHALFDKLVNRVVLTDPSYGDDNKIMIELKADVSKIVDGLDMTQQVWEHGDTREPIGVMKNMGKDKVFSVITPVSTSDIKESNLLFSPNPVLGDFINVNKDGIPIEGSGIIYDVMGKYITNTQVISGQMMLKLSKGEYIAEVLDLAGKKSTFRFIKL